jgi:signal transduction histidine kinase
LSAGLLKAIEFELQLIDKAGVYVTNFETIGYPVPLDAQKELILFRIVQEAINNIIKHARAGSILIKTEFGEKDLSLSVEDDGCGFEMLTDNNDMNRGMGLRNMQSRVQLINGEFRIQSDPSGGTKIQITVPL